MTGYYDRRLSASSLRRCYEIASPRVRQYLDAEIGHVISRVASGDVLLDAGCGYGRAVPTFAGAARFVVGVDTSAASLAVAAIELAGVPNCLFARMDATDLAFTDGSFDVVACIQNGVSAFHVDLHVLAAELLRVTRPGGRALLSTYSEGFWDERLAWFRAQADAGLIGPIDEAKTGDGVIVCEDGFAAGTVSSPAMEEALRGLDADMETVEVDASSLFFELRRRA